MQKLSEDPFGLYQTYIHKGCVNQYMQQLSESSQGFIDPIRKLPDVHNFSTAMKQYLKDIVDKGNDSDEDEDEDAPTFLDDEAAQAG